MSYRLVVFDFDGTLVDSLDHSVAVFRRLAPSMGFKPFDDLDAARSMPTRQLMKKLGIPFWRLPRIVRAFQTAAAEGAEGLKLIPGIRDMLAGLQLDGIRLGVLSSNREETIRACLKANEVEQYFDFVVGYPKLFGKARALRRILRSEKLPREEVLYVGDELRDVEAAQKAKVAVAAVSWGWHVQALLEEAKPTAMMATPADVLAMTKAA